MIPEDMIAAIEYRHPFIANRITQIWGDTLCVSYMNSLMLPAYYDEQEVFHEPECNAIMALIELHDGIYPRQDNDVWALR